jgi:hypothetical protein
MGSGFLKHEDMNLKKKEIWNLLRPDVIIVHLALF